MYILIKSKPNGRGWRLKTDRKFYNIYGSLAKVVKYNDALCTPTIAPLKNIEYDLKSHEAVYVFNTFLTINLLLSFD